MLKKKKNNPPKKVDSLAIWKAITKVEEGLKGVNRSIEKFYNRMGSIEKNLSQIGLNKQNINTLKNNVKNINDIRIKNIKLNLKNLDDELENKVNKKAFYTVVGSVTGILVLVITILELVRIFLIK